MYINSKKDTVDYCNKFRKLNIKLLDGQAKTLMVDDSQTVGQLMIYICSQMSIANHEEYSLIHDLPEAEKERTLKRDKATLPRDFKKMEIMKRKLHTDDDSKILTKCSPELRSKFTICSFILKLPGSTIQKLFGSSRSIKTRCSF